MSDQFTASEEIAYSVATPARRDGKFRRADHGPDASRAIAVAHPRQAIIDSIGFLILLAAQLGSTAKMICDPPQLWDFATVGCSIVAVWSGVLLLMLLCDRLCQRGPKSL